MIFGQLLQNDTYRVEVMKTLEAEKVQTLTPRETRTTQALKVYIKLKGTPLPVLLDTGVWHNQSSSIEAQQSDQPVLQITLQEAIDMIDSTAHKETRGDDVSHEETMSDDVSHEET